MEIQNQSYFSKKVSFNFVHSLLKNVGKRNRFLNVVSHVRLIVYDQSGALYVQLDRIAEEAGSDKIVGHSEFIE